MRSSKFEQMYSDAFETCHASYRELISGPSRSSGLFSVFTVGKGLRNYKNGVQKEMSSKLPQLISREIQ
jgi:spore germination protein GerM